MKFAKEKSAGFLVNHLARLFARGLQDRIKPLGLTTGTFPALLELWEHEGLTQKQLVDRLDIEQATIANTLARMERDGLIVRKKDAADGRAQRIWLTEKARALRSPAYVAAGQVNAGALQRLSASERRQFMALVSKLIAGLQEFTSGDRRDSGTGK